MGSEMKGRWVSLMQQARLLSKLSLQPYDVLFLMSLGLGSWSVLLFHAVSPKAIYLAFWLTFPYGADALTQSFYAEILIP